MPDTLRGVSRSMFFFILVASTAMLLMNAGRALGQTSTTWNGGTGNWSDTTNWSNGLPNSASYLALVDGGNNASTSTATVDGDFTVGQLTISDVVAIANGNTLTIDSSAGFPGAGNVSGGTLTLNSSGSTTRLFAAGNLSLATTITGNGNANNIVTGTSGKSLAISSLFNSGIGNFGGGALNISLTGSISVGSATETLIQPLSTFVESSSGGLALGKGSMRLTGSGAITLDGNISVSNNGSGSGSATFTRDASTTFTNFDSVTRTLNGGNYNLIANSGAATVSLNAGNIFINNATIAFTSAGCTFDGLSAMQENRKSFSLNGVGFTTAAALKNTGVLSEAFETFTVNGAMTNSGTVSIGSDIGRPGIFAAAGYTQTAGATKLGGTTVLAANLNSTGLINIQAGRLEGAGTVNGNVENGGVLAPFTAFGQNGRMTINGSLTLDTTSSLEFREGTVSDFGLRNDSIVSGVTTLAGTLSLFLRAGTPPTGSDSFTLMQTSGFTGSFANILNGQRLLTSDGVTSFLVHYGVGSTYSANNLVIDSFQAPEPAALALVASLGILFTRRRGGTRQP